MTSITHQAPIGTFRAANETHLTKGGISQREFWAEGANLEGIPLGFKKATDTLCHIEPATVRDALTALDRLARD